MVRVRGAASGPTTVAVCASAVSGAMAAATTGVTPTDLRNVRLEKFGPDADASAVAEEEESSPAGRERVCSDTSTSLLGEAGLLRGKTTTTERRTQNAERRTTVAAAMDGRGRLSLPD